MSKRETSYPFHVPGWHDTPRVVRRTYWILLVVTAMTPGGTWGVAMLLGWSPAGSGSLVLVVSAMIAAAALARLTVRAWRSRLLRRLEAAGDRLCTECGYDLRVHDGPIQCPECGAILDMSVVRATWRAFRAGIGAR